MKEKFSLIVFSGESKLIIDNQKSIFLSFLKENVLAFEHELEIRFDVKGQNSLINNQ